MNGRPRGGRLLDLARVPLESWTPLVSFASIRVLLAAAAFAAYGLFGFPYGTAGAVVLGGVALPWSLAVHWLTRRSPQVAMNPLVAVGDLAVVGSIQAAEPQTYGAVHFAALFFVAAHAHFQGERGGLLVAVVAAAVVVPVSFAVDVPANGGTLHLDAVLFTVAVLCTGIVVGALRAAESSSRLRARALSQRTINTEAALRQRLAESIHDGPIQELSSVDMMLASAERALKGSVAHAAIVEARTLLRSNVRFLRDEIVELGPQAFEELSFDQAIADCLDTWRRRYGVAVETDVSSGALPPRVAEALFRITQEAVANAGKHAAASRIKVVLRQAQPGLVLEVVDDGHGFGEVDPLGPSEPGHLGLASMRERAEMLGGRLTVDSGAGGTRVRVDLPD